MRAHEIVACAAGISLLAVGLLLHYHIGRRRFCRRNVAGVQQFTSYRRALWVTFCERLAGLIATLFITAGGLLLAALLFTI